MAKMTISKPKSSSSSSSPYALMKDSAARPNILASCYRVDVSSAGQSGVPEVSSGIPSPPASPPLAACNASYEQAGIKGHARKVGAAHTITEESERLFCGTLQAVFLGEREQSADSLVVGAHTNVAKTNRHERSITSWVEVWDYAGGTRFRGFVAGEIHRSLFVFFDADAIGKDLKQGMMALIELAATPSFDCSNLIICLDRQIDRTELQALIRDLGWVGFELTTLDRWAGCPDVTSQRWLLLEMEV
ncbi:hypothetical protein L228DRAFT_285477 [Xylona heveae TC161]|uniref:Ornithine decarboxylase antizyme n=1 Tax=Xylona heveae (strain CBS 132557 / TC161) TaxID=1328760 RepID=A0A165A8S6_XYLHT|nr:hypothetical protein L228DRAFT_285477 [Xylona heveae TC161]KZF20103.1 hypothetical protein L228DRAFT_285477 [Xylona heveae TC161]